VISAGNTNLAEVKASASIIAVLPKNFSRLPSFFSAFIARRYSFDLEIAFRSRGSITTSRKPIKLRIPVQVVHSPKEKCPERLSEVDMEDYLEAPPYVT
jgi:hypothetical protein